jgi:hypothetical protein
MLLDFKNHVAIKTSGRFVPLSTKGEAPEIKSPGFQKWGNVNMYRTSYNDMSNRVSLKQPKEERLSSSSISFCFCVFM